MKGSLGCLVALLGATLALPALAQEQGGFQRLEDEYARQVRPLVQQYCIDCHGEDAPEGDLNLQQFAALASDSGH